MNSNILASIVVLSMFLISSMMYQHKGRRYAEGKTEKISSAREFSLVYRYLQISTLVITLLAFNSDASWLLEVHHSEVVRFIGLAAAGMAIAVFLGAKVSLGRHYSPCFDSFVPQDIVQDGIYNYIRHPIYTSNIFLLFSIFVATGSIWLLVKKIQSRFPVCVRTSKDEAGVVVIASLGDKEHSLSHQLDEIAAFAESFGIGAKKKSIQKVRDEWSRKWALSRRNQPLEPNRRFFLADH